MKILFLCLTQTLNFLAENLTLISLLSLSTGFLTILVVSVWTGLASLLLRSHLEEDYTTWQISMVALLATSLTSTSWVLSNQDLKLFAINKLKAVLKPNHNSLLDG